MKTRFILAAVLAAAIPLTSVQAEDRAKRADAEAMVKKGVEFLKKYGRDKAVEEFTAPSKSFVDRDLYLVIYDMGGTAVAHGQNKGQVGRNLIALKDPDGKPFVQERVDLAKSQGAFWQDYKFTDPLTKKVLPKQMYCQKEGELIVCGGVYKD